MEAPARQEVVERIAQAIEQGFEYNGQPFGPAVEFEALTASEFYARPRVPAENLLGPLVVRGKRLVIGAATGEGKSTFTWWMIKALATGGRFLDWKSDRPYRVLVVDAEQDDDDLSRLIRETRLEQSANVVIVHVPDGLSLNSSEDERVRLEVLLEQGEFDVVVLDPLYKLHTGNPNDEQEAVALMKLFDHWRTKFRFCLVLPSHMRKPDRKARMSDFTMHEIFGASAFLRGAERIIGIKLITDGTTHLHFFKGRSPGLPVRQHWVLGFDRDAGFVLRTGAPGKNPETEELRRIVHEILSAAGKAGISMAALAEETGRPKSTLHRILKDIGAYSTGGGNRVVWTLGISGDAQEAELWAEDDEDD